MALKIRLRKQGRHNRPFFRLVVTDVRCPRDGKYLEMLGWYDPRANTPETSLKVDGERVRHWLDLGAEISDCAHSLVKKVAPQVASMLVERAVAKREKARVSRRAKAKAS